MLQKDYLTAAIDIAKKAGVEIRAAAQTKLTIECKDSAVDLVTETDQRVEKLIISYLKNKFPSHSFIGEESTAAGCRCNLTDNPTWIIDPIDGTTNFVHGFPFVAVSIGLAIGQENVVGVVYNPILEDMFTAIKGQGALCNDKPIRCSGQKDIAQSLLIAEIGATRGGTYIETKLATIAAVIGLGVHGMRSLGSAALNLCQIARGGADVYYEYGIHCWDVAAGELILREAGGVTMDSKGGPLDMMSRFILAASSKEVAEAIIPCLTHIEYERD